MTEGSLIAPVAPRLAAARETVAAALVFSVAAHAGLILWAVSGAPTREIALRAGSPVTMEVVLVQGPDAAPAGSRSRHADELTARTPDRAVSHDAQRPAESAAPEKIPAPQDQKGGASEGADTPLLPTARPVPVATHQAPAPDAAAAADAAPPPARSPVPHPPAKPTPPPLAHAVAAAVSPSVTAPALHDKTSASAVAVDYSAAPKGSAAAADASSGSDGMQGAAPRADNPAPDYPYLARLRGESGRVVLDVEVLASGEAGVVRVEESSGYDILDQAALESVKRWRFVPARRNGAPVPASVRIPIRFALQ